MRSLKFLLVPNVSNSYDLRMMENLGRELSAFGHSVSISSHKERQYIEVACRLNPDVVIAVNKTRPQNFEFKNTVRFLSWYQDVFPKTSQGLILREGDILYTLGTASQLGLETEGLPVLVKQLFTGVNESNRYSVCEPIWDFSLCGGLPVDITSLIVERDSRTPIRGSLSILLAKIRRGLRGQNFLGLFHDDYVLGHCAEIVRNLYVPLEGGLDIHLIYKAVRQNLAERGLQNDRIDQFLLGVINRVPTVLLRLVALPHQILKLKNKHNQFLDKETQDDEISSWFAQTYPRIIDRELLIMVASEVSRNIAIFGTFMDVHAFSKPYFKGIIDSEEGLAKVYASSKVNLGNNTHGLGLHSRNLGVMAAGGYLLHHRSKNPVSGSLENEFEEGIHYDGYSGVDELKEKLRVALANSVRRKKLGHTAQKFVYSKHTWKHRAEQILADLDFG